MYRSFVTNNLRIVNSMVDIFQILSNIHALRAVHLSESFKLIGGIVQTLWKKISCELRKSYTSMKIWHWSQHLESIGFQPHEQLWKQLKRQPLYHDLLMPRHWPVHADTVLSEFGWHHLQVLEPYNHVLILLEEKCRPLDNDLNLLGKEETDWVCRQLVWFR